MINLNLGSKKLTVELRNGTGLDIEFCDSKPVWTYNEITGDIVALPFKGTVILLPFIVITFGYVYTTEELEFNE
jgi:hypothetical protein|tara:strand:+ start:619 stop:840 length:222 start_codon:yes stop_codon:yes gene_type:complete